MKPLKLSMTAFGPYKDKEVIDFSRLDHHHLFVISGAREQGRQPYLMAFVLLYMDPQVAQIVKMPPCSEAILLMMIPIHRLN